MSASSTPASRSVVRMVTSATLLRVVTAKRLPARSSTLSMPLSGATSSALVPRSAVSAPFTTLVTICTSTPFWRASISDT